MKKMDIEWSGIDPAYCWVEIFTIWSSKDFRSRLQSRASLRAREKGVVTGAPKGNGEA